MTALQLFNQGQVYCHLLGTSPRSYLVFFFPLPDRRLIASGQRLIAKFLHEFLHTGLRC